MASNGIKGITIEINGDATGLEKALKNVNSAVINTKKELKEVNNALKFNPESVELLAQKQRMLGDAISETTNKLQILKSAQKEAQSQLANGTISQSQFDALSREIVKAESELKNFTNSAKENQSILDRVQGTTTGLASNFTQFGNACTNLGNKLSGISASAAVVVGGLVSIAKTAASTADEISTIAKQTGLSTAEVQQLQYASSQIDVSFDDVSSAIKKMKGNLTSSADAFKNIGVKIRDQNNELRNTDAIFEDCIVALSKIKNETERDAAAMAIFGKNADQLAGLIDDGGAALRRLSQEAQNKGLIISDEDLAKANEFNDALDSIKTQIKAAFSSAGAKMANALLPIIQGLADAASALAEVIAKIPEPVLRIVAVIAAILAVAAPLLIIVGQMSIGIGALISAFAKLPTILATISAAFSALSTSVLAFLAANGPTILAIAGITAVIVALGLAIYEVVTHWDEISNATTNAMHSMGQAISNSGLGRLFSNQMDSIKTFVTSGLEEIKNAFTQSSGLLKGVWSAGLEAVKQVTITALRNITGLSASEMQMLESKIGSVWDSIKNSIASKWNQIVNDTRQRARDFVNNIVDTIRELPQRIRQALNQLKQALVEKISKPFEDVAKKASTWGKDLIDNFVGGLTGNAEKIKNATQKIAQTIDDNIGFSEPKEGPLSDFHKNAPDMVDLWVKGIKENMYKVTGATTLLANAMNPANELKADMKSTGSTVASGSTSTMNVYVDHISELSDLIRIQNQAQQRNRMGVRV